MDYLKLIKESKRIIGNPNGYPAIKIAVLGDNATQQLVQVLRAYLYRQGVFADIYEAEFDIIEQEIYNTESGLYGFKPEYVLVNVSVQKLRDRYYRVTEKDLARFTDVYRDFITGLWRRLGEKLHCRIVQNLFALPLERPLGSYTVKVRDSFYSLVSQINQQIIEKAQDNKNVLLNDLEYVSSLVGRQHWFDEKLWVHGKLFCRPDYLPFIAKNVSDIILAGAGKSRKCIVLDLDNTLWGGIIGDDGMDNIEVGNEGLGEAYSLFQRYLLDLKKQGVILAVCSKNDRETAMEVFERHPGMVLRKADIAAFVINWEPKSENIKQIAKTLNIGLDAMVFVDDSAFERNQVRSMLPQVLVPEMPDDPAEFVPVLNQLNLFETTSISEEDKKRSDFYRSESQREEVKAQFGSLEEYLKSLEMEAVFARFDQAHLPRIVQLIQRSNQFNLTTKRYNERECEDFMKDTQQCHPFYVTLQDKFGDSGLISVIILKKEGEKILVDEWLMSCRVLSRGVEQFAMNKVVETARNLNCRRVEGRYIPSAKNKMVSRFYEQFGFKEEGVTPEGTVWGLDVREYEPRQVWITENSGQKCPA